MTNEEIIIAITKHKEEIGSLKHRLSDIEELCKSVNDLAISVTELAMNVSNYNARLDGFERSLRCQGERIGEIEKQPAKKWEAVVSAVLTTVIGALVGFIVSKVF